MKEGETFVGNWYNQRARGKTPELVKALSKDKSDFIKTKRYNVKANINQLNSVMRTKPELVNLVVPYGDKTYTLNLAKVDILDNNFEVETKSGKEKKTVGAQYRGIVDGNPEHIASMSLTETDKSAYFSNEEGNFVITKDGAGFVVYNDKEIETPDIAYCETPEELPSDSSCPPVGELNIETSSELISGVGCKVVNIYVECDYAFYQNKGSNINTLTDYVVGIFNQVATIYANEDIAIKISSLYVWTTLDPYSSMSSSATLTAFRANRGTTFNGHLAHFLSTRSPLGGIAYVNTLCNKAYAYGVSRVTNSYNSFPTYSWTVNVVAHELGHNLGSNHTQSCSWSGGALDNCYTTEGGCAPGPAPVGGGTIMSYCHLTNYGVNFNKGFGLQPGNLIRSRVQNASCITPTTEADPPTGLSTTNIASTSATLNWNATPSTSTYTVQYKLTSSSTWLTAGTTSSTTYNLTGLTAGTNYQWKVKSDCSPYSTIGSLLTLTGSGGTTTCTEPSSLVTSNITTTSATLGWATTVGATSYSVQYKTSSAATWITLSTTNNSVNITGLSASTGYVWKVKANCSVYSVQKSFTTGVNVSGCSIPTNPHESSITSTSVRLNWTPPVNVSSSYVLYRPYGQTSWILRSSIVGNYFNLSSLLRGKQYQWKVRSICINGTTSLYTPVRSFVTLP